MLNSNVITLIILTCKMVHSQHAIHDVCTIEATRSSGVCKLLGDCPQVQDDLGKLSICGNQSIVCCPTTTVDQRKPGEISIKKCREYSKFVSERRRPPILLIKTEKVKRDECGHKVVTLIVGGDLAGTKEFPHMAAVGYLEAGNKIKWNCGGTILSERYVLTAGHCLVSQEFGPAIRVRVGVTNLKDRSHSQELKVIDRIHYPGYKSRSNYHDVGLLRLEAPIKLNPFARPACLYTKTEITAERAIATGFGDTSYGGKSSDDLRKVTLNLIEHTSCDASYKKHISRRFKNGILDNSQVCAGSDEIKDTCQGDSGGPLQIYHVNDDIKCMYDVIGITSFGKGCHGSPGVYTRVSYYIKWIEDIVWPPS